MAPEPRVEVIEGRRTLVVERTPPLPATLNLLLNGGRDDAGRIWTALNVTNSLPLRLSGARTDCLGQDHRLADWLHGWHSGSDGVIRFLSLAACQDCGSICVRDRSRDTLAQLPTGGRAPRRKDHVIGWYSGARPTNRTYGRNLT